MLEADSLSSASEENTVSSSTVDFFGDAKRLSGRMCSKLEKG